MRNAVQADVISGRTEANTAAPTIPGRTGEESSARSSLR